MGDRDGGGSRGRLDESDFGEVMESAHWYGQRIVAQELKRAALAAGWNPADHATYCPQHNEPPPDGGGSSWLCCCSGPLFELRVAARALIDAEYGSNTWAEAWDVLVDVVAEQERLEVAAEDRAGEVAFRGEEHVARLEAEANKP